MSTVHIVWKMAATLALATGQSRDLNLKKCFSVAKNFILLPQVLCCTSLYFLPHKNKIPVENKCSVYQTGKANSRR
jgi:hypothetical protein